QYLVALRAMALILPCGSFFAETAPSWASRPWAKPIGTKYLGTDIHRRDIRNSSYKVSYISVDHILSLNERLGKGQERTQWHREVLSYSPMFGQVST
ncbi:MAG: hypothetical protein OIF40_14590, partial [Mangrovicoccus sp.]|nr:hypothetical protein [Mangrovicoccus sp.]